ncbi:MAG: hypothetical protein U0992_18525 [Planctomycetaceae bacterium]
MPAAVLKSTKKKAKPTTQAAEPGIPKWVWALFILVGFGVGSVGGYLGVTAILSAAAKDNADAPPEPLTYSEHAHKEGNFKFDYPNGWEVASGGGTGGVPPWGTFSKDDVSVDIRADLKGASIADIANAGANQSTEELPPELSPVAKVHQFQHDVKYKIEYDDFEETPGGFYDVPFGRGWLSEFTASEGAFGGKIHGYRLTLLGGMHQFNVICKCQEKNWRRTSRCSSGCSSRSAGDERIQSRRAGTDSGFRDWQRVSPVRRAEFSRRVSGDPGIGDRRLVLAEDWLGARGSQ